MDKYAAQGIDAATPNSVRGRLDEVRDLHFYGWAADTSNFDHKLIVEIIEGDEVIATGVAAEMRGDLHAAGIGDGKHGFYIPIPPQIYDCNKHNLFARIAGTGVALDNHVSYAYVNTVQGEITGLEGAEISGVVNDDDGVASVVEIVESGKVIATANTDEHGNFRARLPAQYFDGCEHLFVARTQIPAVEFAKKTVLVPAISAGELVLRQWIGATNAQDLSDEEKSDLILGKGTEDDRDFLVVLILHSGLFDHGYYRQQSGRARGMVEAVEHFLSEGGAQGLRARPDFVPEDYRMLNPDLPELSDTQCFVHYALKGRQERRYFNLAILKKHAAKLRFDSDFDADWYAAKVGNVWSGMNCYEHYLAMGWRKGIMPNRNTFDSELYLSYAEDSPAENTPPYLRMKERLRLNLGGLRSFASSLPEFDPEHYRSQLKKPLAEGVREDLHYLCHGIEKKLNPNPEFSTEYYVRKYKDLEGNPVHPFVHYIVHGKKEGRVPKLNPAQYIHSGGRAYKPGKPTILIVCHEASRTGAPILGLRLVEYFAQKANVISWVGKQGPLTDMFAKSSVAVINTFLDHTDSVWIVRELKRRYDLHSAVANSACTVDMADALHEEMVPLVALVHEYGDYMEKQVVRVLKAANHVVFPAEGVRESARTAAFKNLGLMSNNTSVRHQGRCIPPSGGEGKEFTQEEILEAVGIFEGDEKPAIVLGCGSVQMRKGVELFIEAARFVKLKLKKPVRFIWVGGGYLPDTELAYSAWIRSQIVNSGLENEVFFFEETIDLDPFFDLADVFFLSSRLDPFPNVAIDAVNAMVPVVAFERGTGFAEFIQAHPSVGTAAPYLDMEAAANAICDYVNGVRVPPAKSKQIMDLFSFADYAEYVLDLCQSAVKQQQMINDEVVLIQNSGLMNVEFIKQLRTDWNPVLPLEYQYVDMWARGISLANPLIGGNDRIVSLNASATAGWPCTLSPLAGVLMQGASPFTHEVLFADTDTLADEAGASSRIALHLHVSDVARLDAILQRLAAPTGQKIDLFVTTTDEDNVKPILNMMGALPHETQVTVTPKRGRELGAFIMQLQEQLSSYDLVGHCHDGGMKQEVPGVDAERLKNYLYDSLLGKDGEMLGYLVQEFRKDAKLGLVFAETPVLDGWGKNYPIARELWERLECTGELEKEIEFPFGQMFWARPAALKPLMRRAWEWNDFSSGVTLQNAGIQQAITRLIPSICRQAGYQWKTVLNPSQEAANS